jgi:uncharacterized protein
METQIIALAILAGFFVQSVIGFGATMTALPILLIVLPFQDAVAFMAIYLALFSVFFVVKERRFIPWPMVLKLTFTGLVGLFLGIQVLKIGDPILLKRLLGVVILIYVGYKLMKRVKSKRIEKMHYLFGFLGGLFSGLFSSGGPLFIIYIQNTVHGAREVRAAIIGVFGIINLSRIPIMMSNGLLTNELFELSLIILPVFFGAILLGNVVFHRLNNVWFKNIVLVVLAILAVSLLVG